MHVAQQCKCVRFKFFFKIFFLKKRPRVGKIVLVQIAVRDGDVWMKRPLVAWVVEAQILFQGGSQVLKNLLQKPVFQRFDKNDTGRERAKVLKFNRERRLLGSKIGETFFERNKFVFRPCKRRLERDMRRAFQCMTSAPSIGNVVFECRDFALQIFWRQQGNEK